ncbi:MAG TPA: hypothetical protein VMG58_04380 [Candidatus Sulfotelmatobacter sp.]|nr:hypothetical protein [Candidatus Sulfotelmatobacter sp.]
MVDEPLEPYELICPCCHAKLRVDPALRAVLSHEPPPEPPRAVRDLTEAVKGLQSEAAQRQAKFEESLRAEKGKKDLLDKRFQDALKRTKDQPITKPIRDIDLE